MDEQRALLIYRTILETPPTEFIEFILNLPTQAQDQIDQLFDGALKARASGKIAQFDEAIAKLSALKEEQENLLK